jgi:Flp pilus assembly protein TadG
MMRWVREPLDDRGSAPVEFVFVAPLVLLIFAAIVQIALAMHVRSTLVASAAEGARAGAEYGSDPRVAIERTRAAVATSIADGVVQDISVRHERNAGVPVVAVTIRAKLPLFGLLGPSTLVVTGHALDES